MKKSSRALVAALAAVIAGCGSGSGASSRATTATVADSGAAVHVVMKVLEFTPATVDAKVGQTLTWTNEDTSPHNVTYVSGPVFRSSPRVLNPGRSFVIKLTESGTIHYFCSIHPWMKGTIIVSP